MQNKKIWKRIIFIFMTSIILVLFIYLIFRYRQYTTSKYVGTTTSTVPGGTLITKITETKDQWQYSYEFNGNVKVAIDYVINVDNHSYIFLCRIIDESGVTWHITQNVYVDNKNIINSLPFIQVSHLTSIEKEEWIDYLESINNYEDESINIVVNILKEIE